MIQNLTVTIIALLLFLSGVSLMFEIIMILTTLLHDVYHAQVCVLLSDVNH